MNDEIVGEVLLRSAAEFRAKLNDAAEVAKSKKATHVASNDFLEKIEIFLTNSVRECENPNVNKEDALKRSLDTMRAVATFAKNTRSGLLEDAARAQGLHEGMSIVINVLEETGGMRLREGKRIAELAVSEADLEARRKVGERPESLRVKRKVAALRESTTPDANE